MTHSTSNISPLVQYILLRKDLTTKYPKLYKSKGAIIAQACHASTAALFRYVDRQETKMYVEDWRNMHKMILAVRDEEHLQEIHEKLKQDEIEHVMWEELPEGFHTALAIRPYRKSNVEGYFRECKLF